jgi:hypothetical protein
MPAKGKKKKNKNNSNNNHRLPLSAVSTPITNPATDEFALNPAGVVAEDEAEGAFPVCKAPYLSISDIRASIPEV